MSDILESLFQGMDILIDKKLENVSFDSTIICAIVDNSNCKNGQYKVSDGSVSYIAYSDQSDYRVGDQVRVTIPMGDFSQKKFITGKYSIDDNNQPITYVSPADKILNISNNLISKNSLMASILANGTTLEKIIWQEELDDSFTSMQTNNLYNTIILKADFKTLLDSYDLVQGNYGLRLDLLVKPSIDSKVKMLRHLELDSSEMFGNPYAFAIPSTQSKILKIDSIGIVLAVELVLYQKDNFLNNRQERVKYLSDATKDNIIVNNIVVGFGCDLELLEDNKLQIYTTNEPTYKYGIHNETTNLKNMGLLWINKDENNQYIGFSDGIYDFDYDELAYLRKTKLDNRLLAQKGKENVPQDKESLQLSANIEEGAAAINKALNIISTDLFSLLKDFQLHIPSSTDENNVYYIINKLITIPEEDNDTPASDSLLDIISVIENNLQGLQERYINTLKYGYETWQDISDEERTVKWEDIDFSTPFLGNLVDRIHFLEGKLNTIMSTPVEGYGSICDTYKIRITKLWDQIKKIMIPEDPKNPLKTEFWGGSDYNTLKNYKEKNNFQIYQTPDLSSYDNKYCIYWYRWEKDYVALEDEQLLPNGWRRLTIADFNAPHGAMDEDKINIGLSSFYVDDKDQPILNNKGQKIHAPKPAPGYGVVKRYMQNDLEQEKYMAVLFYNHQMYKSNELIFINSEVVPDKTTLDKGDILIFEHINESRDGYQCYAITNYLMDIRDQKFNRQIRCHYDGLLAKDNAFVNGQIYWYVPTVSTMLTVDEAILINNGFELDHIKSEVVYQIANDITENNFKTKKSKLYKMDNGKYCLLTSNDDKYDNNITYYYRGVGSELCFYKTILATKKDGEFQYEWDQWDYTNGTKIDNRDFWYKIKPCYEDSAKNNYIRCEFIQHADVDSVWGEQLFSFGVAGTSGTKYTLAISPTTSRDTADENEGLPLTIELKDFNNNLIPLNDLSINWYFRQKGKDVSDKDAPNIFTSFNSDKTQAFALTPPKYWGLIEASTKIGLKGNEIADEGEDLANRFIDLKVLYSIPYAFPQYLIEGPTQVIYNSLGTLDNTSMFNTPYKLFIQDENGVVEEVENITWKLSYLKKNGEVTAALKEEEKDFYNNYMPKLDSKDNTLVPAPMYLDNLDCYPVLQAWEGSDVRWQQVLIIMQNRYSSAILNDWDGEFQINEDNGTIMGTMFGAGIKNDGDNTFSGVLMGNVGSVGINTSNSDIGLANQSGLGIYGFHHGGQSFGFSIDGTAFLGKVGNGRIIFNGNNGIIASANWFTGGGKIGANGNISKESTAGMCIDLDDGHIDAYNFKLTSAGIKLNSTPSAGQYYANIGNDEHYIRFKENGDLKIRAYNNDQSNGVVINTTPGTGERYFLVQQDADNLIEFKKTSSGTEFNLKSNHFILDAWNNTGLYLNSAPDKGESYFRIDTSVENGNGIRFWRDSDGNDQFKIKSQNFNLTAGEQNSTDYLFLSSSDQSANTTINDHSSKLWRIIAGNKFGVTKAGDLYASNVHITGDITATSGTFTGTINADEGKIGGWHITEDGLYSNLGSYNNASVGICSDRTKDDGSIKWAFWAGWTSGSSAPFYVKHDGFLHATGADIEGTITASSGSIGGCTISDGVLKIKNINIAERIKAENIETENLTVKSAATISGTLSADKIDGGEISGCSININDTFKVTSGGHMTASSGTINGAFSISTNGTFSFGSGVFKIGYTSKTNTAGQLNDSYLEVTYKNTRYIGITNTIRYVHNTVGGLQDFRYMTFIYGILVGDHDSEQI